MPTIKKSASWENVKRAENLSQMMQKDRMENLGRMLLFSDCGGKEFLCHVGTPISCRQLPEELCRETVEPLMGSAGKMEDPSHRQEKE